MKKLIEIIFIGLLAIFSTDVIFAQQVQLKQPSTSTPGTATVITSTTSGSHYSLDVNLVGGTATIEALIAPFGHTVISTPITVAPAGVATYTLPAHPATGVYDIAADSTGIIYYAEDKVATSGARMMMRANEHTWPCEGNLCTLPTNIQFSNPTAATVTIYIRTMYQ